MLRDSDTEKLICTTFLELMASKSCVQIKVTELVKQANIGRSSFYIYFDSIYDVISKLEDDFLEGLPNESLWKINPVSSNDKNVLSTVSYMKENMCLFRALCGENGPRSFQVRTTTRFAKFFENIQQSADTTLSASEVRLLCESVAGGLWNMCKWWAFHEADVSEEQMASLIMRIIKKIFEVLET